MTFAEYAPTVLETKGNVRARSRINVEGHLRNHALPFFGPMRMAQIQPAHVRAWVRTLSERGLAPSSVKAIYRTFARVMRLAEIDGVVARSPTIGIELPAETASEEMHFLSPEQVSVLADAITPRYRAAIVTAAYAGVRANELWALRIGHVDLRKRVLSVSESLSEVRGALVVGPTKTRNRRSVSLPATVADMLGEHIAHYPSDGHVFSAAQEVRRAIATSWTDTSTRLCADSQTIRRRAYPRACASTTSATPAPRSLSRKAGARSSFRSG
jgi:integrase